MTSQWTRFARCLGCVIAIVLVSAIGLGWSAHLHWNTPVLPRDRLVLPARDFRVVMGAGAEDGEALHVGAIGDDGNSVQAHALEHLRARDFPILHYRFEHFPRTLELAFIFRRADKPDDVHAISVPWPGDGGRTVDLRNVDEWQGDIVEIGFAEYATAQLVPPSSGFRPFRFDRVELSSLSWRGGLAALHAAWFGYRPWALMSISALVPDRGTSGAGSPLLAMIGMTAAGLVALALVLRWRRPRVLGYLALAGAALWILLDVRWLDDFASRHSLTERIYAGRPWEEREHLQPDENVALVADQVRSWIGGGQSTQRLLVEADSDYVYLRLAYLLLPHNVGLLYHAHAATLPPDSLILLYASSNWVYDAARRVLRNHAVAYPVEPVFEAAGAHLYRVRGTR
jgi:hypothetical protein